MHSRDINGLAAGIFCYHGYESYRANPWGEMMGRLPRGSDFAMAKIDFVYQQKMRQMLPALQHKVL